MKKVSIIMPIYNVSQYLYQSIESVIHQTLDDIEIICVNDGSTDGSLEIINKYALRDQRIVIITGPNEGYGKAVNKGLDIASGEYVGIVEPDDYIVPEMFEELYLLAKEHYLDLIKADFYRFIHNDYGKEVLTYNLLDETKERYGQVLYPSKDPSCIYFAMNTWSGIYRNEFIKEYNIRHNETPGASFQDNGFFFQTFIYAERGMIINKAYYRNRRDNPNSSVKIKGNIYAMNKEYDYIRDILMKDETIWDSFKYMYWWKKYKNFWFNYNRIDASDREAYWNWTVKEFRRAIQQKQMRAEEFSRKEWGDIQRMIYDSSDSVGRITSIRVVQSIFPYIPKPLRIWGRKGIEKGIVIYNKIKSI